jgi:hypothetical protein
MERDFGYLRGVVAPRDTMYSMFLDEPTIHVCTGFCQAPAKKLTRLVTRLTMPDREGGDSAHQSGQWIFLTTQ